MCDALNSYGRPTYVEVIDDVKGYTYMYLLSSPCDTVSSGAQVCGGKQAKCAVRHHAVGDKQTHGQVVTLALDQ